MSIYIKLTFWLLKKIYKKKVKGSHVVSEDPTQLYIAPTLI